MTDAAFAQRRTSPSVPRTGEPTGPIAFTPVPASPELSPTGLAPTPFGLGRPGYSPRFGFERARSIAPVYGVPLGASRTLELTTHCAPVFAEEPGARARTS